MILIFEKATISCKLVDFSAGSLLIVSLPCLVHAHALPLSSTALHGRCLAAAMPLHLHWDALESVLALTKIRGSRDGMARSIVARLPNSNAQVGVASKPLLRGPMGGVGLLPCLLKGYSLVGRASALQTEGPRFKSVLT